MIADYRSKVENASAKASNRRFAPTNGVEISKMPRTNFLSDGSAFDQRFLEISFILKYIVFITCRVVPYYPVYRLN